MKTEKFEQQEDDNKKRWYIAQHMVSPNASMKLQQQAKDSNVFQFHHLGLHTMMCGLTPA